MVICGVTKTRNSAMNKIHTKKKKIIKVATISVIAISALLFTVWVILLFYPRLFISKVVHNTPSSPHFTVVDYSYVDDGKDFAVYQAEIKELLAKHTSPQDGYSVEQMVELNSPFITDPDVSNCRNGIVADVLMIHGLARSPHHMRDLGSYLKDNCIRSRSIVLPGHGADVGLLANFSSELFMNNIYSRAEEFIKNTKGPRYIIGHSYGGLLSGLIAQKYEDDIKGIVLFSPAFSISGSNRKLGFMKHLTYLPLEEHGLVYPVYHRTLTVKSIQNLRIQNKEFNNGPKINIPTLLYQTDADRTTPYQPVMTVAKKMFTSIKYLFYTTNPEKYMDLYSKESITYIDPTHSERKTISMSHLGYFVNWNSEYYSHEGKEGCRNPINFSCDAIPEDVVFGGLANPPENAKISRLVSNPNFNRDMQYLVDFINSK